MTVTVPVTVLCIEVASFLNFKHHYAYMMLGVPRISMYNVFKETVCITQIPERRSKWYIAATRLTNCGHSPLCLI